MTHDAWVTLTNVAQTLAIAFLLGTVWIQHKQIQMWSRCTTKLAQMVLARAEAPDMPEAKHERV